MTDVKKTAENTIEFKLTVPDQLLQKNQGAEDKKTSIIVFDNNTQDNIGTSLIKAETKKKSSIPISPLVEKILYSLNGNDQEDSVERLAFEVNPVNSTQYQAIYRAKLRGLPDTLLKRISIQEDLVASIDMVRCNQTFAFGKPRENRFKLGFEIKPIAGILDEQNSFKKELVQQRISAAIRKFYHCGYENGLDSQERLTLPEFLHQCTHDVNIVGRIAVEIIKDRQDKFHSFRPIDAGTIYKATNQKDAQDNVRKQALSVLRKLKNERIDPKKFHEDEYSWIQVIDGVPVQAFSSEECYVHNFYPLLDIEFDGYPATPIDRMIGAVTTRINIATHNKLYFQYGRASHGMLVIKSDTVNEQVVHRIKQQFNAAINSVNASHRMPIFGIDPASEISYQPIDNSSRDMEFQYLSDNNSRTILAAFQMSPDELPGWAYLSRGTNSQALSECLDLSSRILTKQGLLTITEILNGEKESFIEIWDGVKWTSSRVFLTGPKVLKETELGCGLKIKTSPDHRFKVIDENGEPIWKDQKDLKIGDWVLVNRKPIDGFGDIPIYKNRALSLQIMEILGWMIGDGNLKEPQKRAGGFIKLYYHHLKEKEIWNDHYDKLVQWGLKPIKHNDLISEQEKEKIKTKYGFKNVASNRLSIVIYDTDFVRWLFSLGFTPSSLKKHEGKTIPSFVYVLPEDLRRAFLCGLFSADGGINKKNGEIILTIQNNILREQVRLLLLGIGIRTLKGKGVLRKSSWSSEKTWSSKLYIKDRAEFWKKIGFIQKHKQISKELSTGKKWNVHDCPDSVIRKHVNEIVVAPQIKNLPRKLRNNVSAILSKKINRSCSMNFLINAMEQCHLPIPSWMKDYYVEQISAIHHLDNIVEMADVTVFTEEHSFIAEGFQVHNSSNEWRLEASRDSGLKPLLQRFEDFLNHRIFPLIDEELSKICIFKFVGLDAENQDQEIAHLQQNSNLHLTYNEILTTVEKKEVPKELGGDFPLNPQYQAILDKYLTVGEIKEQFFGMRGASKNPVYDYVRDPFYFQQQMLLAQRAMIPTDPQVYPPLPPNNEEVVEPGNASFNQEADPQYNENEELASEPKSDQEPDLYRAIDQATFSLSKAEKHLSPSKRKVLQNQKKLLQSFVDSWKNDLHQANDQVTNVAHRFLPK